VLYAYHRQERVVNTGISNVFLITPNYWLITLMILIEGHEFISVFCDFYQTLLGKLNYGG